MSSRNSMMQGGNYPPSYPPSSHPYHSPTLNNAIPSNLSPPIPLPTPMSNAPPHPSLSGERPAISHPHPLPHPHHTVHHSQSMDAIHGSPSHPRSISSSISSSTGGGSGGGSRRIRLELINAHNGMVADFRVSLNDSIASFKETVAVHLDVALHDQLIIFPDGIKLDQRLSFASYPSFQRDDDAILFLFNLTLIQKADDTVLKRRIFDVDSFDPIFPTPPLYQAPPFISSCGVTEVRNLPNYVSLFNQHLRQADSYMESFPSRFLKAYPVLFGLKHQIIALEAAIRNLRGHYYAVAKSFNEIFQSFAKFDSNYQLIINGFDDDLNRLRRIELIPSLRSPQRSTLLECANEPKLRAFVGEGGKEMNLMKRKIGEMRERYRTIEEGCNQLFSFLPPSSSTLSSSMVSSIPPSSSSSSSSSSTPPSSSSSLSSSRLLTEVDQLENDLRTHEERRKSLLSATQILTRDHSSIIRYIDSIEEGLRQRNGAQYGIDSWLHPSPTDMIRTLETQKNHHEKEIIQSLEEFHRRLKNILIAIVDLHARVQKEMITTLSRISSLSAEIKSLQHNFPLFNEALHRLSTKFSRLSSLHLLPSAYYFSLFEICRRRSFRLFFHSKANQFIETLIRMRKDEEKKREIFNEEWGQHLPKTLFPFMHERPPYCEIRVIDNENNFIDIDINQLKNITLPNDLPLNIQQGFNAAVSALTLSYNNPASPTAPSSFNPSTSSPQPSPSSFIRRLETENAALKANLALNEISIKTKEDDKKKLDEEKKKQEATIGKEKEEAKEKELLITTIDNKNKELKDANEKLKEMEKQLQEMKKKLEQTPPPSIPAPAPAPTIISPPASAAPINAAPLSKSLLETSNSDLDDRDRQLKSLYKTIASMREQLSESDSKRSELEIKLIAARADADEYKELRTKDLKEKDKEKNERIRIENELKTMSVNSALLLKELNTIKESDELFKEISASRIALSNFQDKDLVLFVKNEQGYYQAYHRGAPHRYLAEEIKIAYADAYKSGAPILGKVIYIERFTAGADAASNPYRLSEGTVFFKLYVDVVQ